MKILIDTHVLLWLTFKPSEIPLRVMDLLNRPENEIKVSSISFIEIALKFGKGKLDLGMYKPEDLIQTAKKMGLEILPLSPEDAASFYQLEKTFHQDPFDRILIWQAIRNKMLFVSRDSRASEYTKYGLSAVW
jgi:PIN domain nuclease of toxin-antitoxin system